MYIKMKTRVQKIKVNYLSPPKIPEPKYNNKSKQKIPLDTIRNQ